MSTTIEVVPRTCIGAGNCVDMADDYFDQNDDDATVIVLANEVTSEDAPRVARAANACPVAAIVLRTT